MTDIRNAPVTDQEAWLEQRGWQSMERHGSKVWKHPELGLIYNFATAFTKALEDCRLPADFELNPVVPPPIRD